MYTINDTIVALSTAAGTGAIAIVRMSGPGSVAIANTIFSGHTPVAQQATHTLQFGKIKDGNEVIDEVVLSLYKTPKSYTGEDMVEISCHGSPYIVEQVIRLCLAHGARPAKPGEFTLRAFLKGKMDLTQAEAVADLIASESSAAHKIALSNLRGGFSAQLKDMREELIKFSSLIELELDFSQEDVEFADRAQLYNLIERLTYTTRTLIDSFKLGNVFKNGVSVAIVGKPNAGKSTLLNALLNEERAIVSEIAGTTRDTVEERLNIQGILFRLIDTAGLRDHHAADTIEKIGMERSRDAMRKADIVIYLFDINGLHPGKDETLLADIQAQKAALEAGNTKYLLVGNKVDEIGEAAAQQLFGEAHTLYISAKNKENIGQLKQALYSLATENTQQEGTVITNTRHLNSLQEMLVSLGEIKKGMDEHLPGDLLSLDIRECLHYLGDITGEVTTEDKLDYIFSKFCIGK